ncbi:MAG: tRNA (adenosine(37)-N6)-threonylcarbamoyltransferase complex ATPase subunit type 1 TsaE [Pyrinomonadaceae bacterium]|nr:tRNA (adenosine(37)-N6)-threonylcarbamoyltransferase complex ATPase subunit type 1 TsaE [Pyrinomonadaceae bacterium]
MIEKAKIPVGEFRCETPEDTFRFGERIGKALEGGEVLLLSGTLGVGKTLLTKGIVKSLDFDADEVTSPSFTLVNLYEAEFDVYHIDLWRVGEAGEPAFAVGLDEILENESAVIIIEWSDHLNEYRFQKEVFRIEIEGDGDQARDIEVKKL